MSDEQKLQFHNGVVRKTDDGKLYIMAGGYCATKPPEEWAALAWANASDPPLPVPTPMLLWCPSCGDRHVDVGEFASKVHHTHACQSCGMVWRPAIGATVGVQFLPGFKNE